MLKKLLSVTTLAAGLACGLFASYPALSETTVRQAPGDDLKQDAKKGWFFYKGPAKEEPKDLEPSKKKPEEKKKDPCLGASGWQPKCGFVDPGSDFEFQAKQRDALMQNMVMNPADSKAVEEFQYYNKWAVDRATAVANMWQYNMVQNPRLDPAVNAPISQFGLQIATELKEAESGEVFNYIEKNGMLLFFTRSDCVYCHTMAGVAKMLEKETGINLWNVSLDAKCLTGFEARCVTEPDSIRPAQALQVTVVPSVFLYIKPNTWIRVSTGVVSVNTMKSRIVSFVTAYRAALLTGADSGGGRPNVDFSEPDAKETAERQAPIRPPTESEIKTMLQAGDL